MEKSDVALTPQNVSTYSTGIYWFSATVVPPSIEKVTLVGNPVCLPKGAQLWWVIGTHGPSNVIYGLRNSSATAAVYGKVIYEGTWS